MLRSRLGEIELRLGEVDRAEARRAEQRGEMLGSGRQTLAAPDVCLKRAPCCRPPAVLEGTWSAAAGC